MTGHNMCGKTKHFHNAFLSVDFVLYSFGPFSVMSVTNFAIAFKFMRAKCKRNSSTQSTEQSLAKSATRGTAMVVTVSVTFLILTAPSAANFILIQGIQVMSDQVLSNEVLPIGEPLGPVRVLSDQKPPPMLADMSAGTWIKKARLPC